MKREFSFYEFAGVVAPGLVALVGSYLLIFGIEGLGKVEKLDLGGLGVLAVFAYVVGQLIQAVGNALESGYWFVWGGVPTAWVRTGGLLAPSEFVRLIGVLRPKLGSSGPKEMDAKAWLAVTREVYAGVLQAKRAERVDIFNGNYGLNRGIASALAVLLLVALVRDWHVWQVPLALGVGTAVAVYRMHRFGVHYARELFVQFLDSRSEESRTA